MRYLIRLHKPHPCFIIETQYKVSLLDGSYILSRLTVAYDVLTSDCAATAH